MSLSIDDGAHLLPMIGTPRATEKRDLPALARFLVRVYRFDPSDHHTDTRLLEWKYLYPRPGWDGGRSYLLEKDGQIVAHCGICPVTFRSPNGNEVRSLTLMDWAAEPSIPGVGFKLFRHLVGMTPTSFVIGGAPPTRKIVPRIGFRYVGDSLTFSAWLRPWREFRIRPRTTRSVSRLLHGFAHLAPRRRFSEHWNFVPVNQFDNSIEPVLGSRKRLWIVCQRSLADLNYLLLCPHLRMQGFLLNRKDQVAGYCIVGTTDWEARLLDLAVDSEDPTDWKLASAAVTQAVRLGPEVCRIRVLANVPILNDALAWNGYWCQYKEPIFIYDPSSAVDSSLPVAFQLFDGDSGY